MEPPNKGHLGVSHFVLCLEVVLFLEVKNVHTALWEGVQKSVLCREVVPFLEGPLSEVPTIVLFRSVVQGEEKMGVGLKHLTATTHDTLNKRPVVIKYSKPPPPIYQTTDLKCTIYGTYNWAMQLLQLGNTNTDSQICNE